jgi:hypothetical protein
MIYGTKWNEWSTPYYLPYCELLPNHYYLKEVRTGRITDNRTLLVKLGRCMKSFIAFN